MEDFALFFNAMQSTKFSSFYVSLHQFRGINLVVGAKGNDRVSPTSNPISKVTT